MASLETLRCLLASPASDNGGLVAIPEVLAMAGSTVRRMRDQFAAGEMSVRLGANTVIMHASPLVWDTYGDLDGNGARRRMRERVIPGLRTFLDRTLFDPAQDVTVALFPSSTAARRAPTTPPF